MIQRSTHNIHIVEKWEKYQHISAENSALSEAMI